MSAVNTRNLTAPATDVVEDNSQFALEKASHFDFALIDERLGFVVPSNPLLTDNDARIDAAAFLLGEIWTFLAEAKSLQAMGGRALGMILCQRPNLIARLPDSTLRKLFGVDRVTLAKYIMSASSRFGFRSVRK
jgi:hypothetical protein